LQAVEVRASTAERELASTHQSLTEETARLVAEREAAEVGAICDALTHDLAELGIQV
jgi:hypothetical protein